MTRNGGLARRGGSKRTRPTSTDFLRVLVVNIASASFFKAGGFGPHPFSAQSIVLNVETALNLLFGGFLVLAIRRQFAPKKPLDSTP